MACIDRSSNPGRMDKQVEWMLNRDLQLAFMESTEHLAAKCDLPKRIMSVPVYFNQPIYGLEVPNFTDFAGPGVILTIIFFLAVALTSGAMLAERNEGILERSLVSGITGTEILFSHVLVQMLVMVIQSGAVLLIGFVFFGLTIRGPIGWVIILTLITGLCGMTFEGNIFYQIPTDNDNNQFKNHVCFPTCSLLYPNQG
ncbi:ABC-2 type transporter domain-containing protein [Phthorimaea operculella]|nr:ABC-2 type transporter domain-containing protein [Phthorimaea operculella]